MWKKIKERIFGPPPVVEMVEIHYNQRHSVTVQLDKIRWYDMVFLDSELRRMKLGMPMKNIKNEELVLRLFGRNI